MVISIIKNEKIIENLEKYFLKIKDLREAEKGAL